MKMKISLFTLIICLVSTVVCSQTQILTVKQVPDVVKQTFQTKFPTVKKVEWKIKSDKNYEAEFTLKKTDMAVKFDTTGRWLETETTIPRSKVPKAVRATLAKQFKGYKLIETQDLQRWDDQRLIYEMHVENAKEIVKLQLYAEGTILNQSSKAKPAKGK